MKKIIVFVGVIVAVATTTTSCKKDYKCQCSKTYTSGNGTSTKDYSVYTYKDTRSRAENRCNDNTDSGTDFFGNYSINCQIQ